MVAQGHCRAKVGAATSPCEGTLATYKFPGFLVKLDHAAFDAVHGVGTTTPYSGIYRCIGCGREVVSTSGHSLPNQNDHQHTPAQGSISWRLIVYADHEPKI
jgi:hypothetical protein